MARQVIGGKATLHVKELRAVQRGFLVGMEHSPLVDEVPVQNAIQ